MKLVIRSPTGQTIEYKTTHETCRGILNSFARQVPTETYSIKMAENEIILQLKEK